MMKQQILTMMVLFSIITIAKAQTGNVGINTVTPQATLDVTGVATDPLKLDGIIAPRLTGNELAVKTYTPTQTGAIVYATAAAGTLASQVINVAAPGYYYFDGTVWQTFKGTANADINIYKDNGTLTSNRLMTMAGNILTMNNAGTSTIFSHNFNESRILNTGIGRGSFSALSGGSALDLYVDNASAAQVAASGTATSLEIGTGNATPINFGTNNITRATITSTGNMGIGTQTPTERLDVATGNVRVRDINTNTGDSTTDKLVVADATGVLKTLTKQTPLLLGGNLQDAISTPITVVATSTNPNVNSLLTNHQFVLTARSLVTFTYTVTYTTDNLITHTANSNKRVDAYLQFINGGGFFPTTTYIGRQGATHNGNTGRPGFWYLSGSEVLLMEPGTYNIGLYGSALHEGTSGLPDFQVTFGNSQDRFTIVAQPIY